MLARSHRLRNLFRRHALQEIGEIAILIPINYLPRKQFHYDIMLRIKINYSKIYSMGNTIFLKI